MIFGYEFIATGYYTIPSYQHVIEPDKKYEPLIEEKEVSFKKPVISIPLKPVKYSKEKKDITIYFDFDSYKVKKSEAKKLKNISGNLILKGYASPEGSRKYNLELSKKRIESVKKIIKKNKVKIIREEAYGEDKCFLPKEKWNLCRKVKIERW